MGIVTATDRERTTGRRRELVDGSPLSSDALAIDVRQQFSEGDRRA